MPDPILDLRDTAMTKGDSGPALVELAGGRGVGRGKWEEKRVVDKRNTLGKKYSSAGTSLAVQGLRLCAPTVGSMGSIPG